MASVTSAVSFIIVSQTVAVSRATFRQHAPEPRHFESDYSMIRIQSIETYPVRIPLKPAYRMVSALGRHEESSFVLVRLLTTAGVEGAGEASITVRWSGETVWGAVA